jgi:5-methylcytosine-specific restriction endonuclease McrA
MAQVQSGITEKQNNALALGRKPGTNNRNGYKHKTESKQKASESHKAWCKANPDKVKARGEKTKGENHYQWKGGVARLNISIRQMTENRKWIQAVKERDRACLFCGSTIELEADHIKPLALIVLKHKIKNRADAKNCAELWDISNGRTLCKKCHCEKDGRKYTINGNGRRKKTTS